MVDLRVVDISNLVTYTCDLMHMCVEFRDEILLKGEECETAENPDFRERVNSNFGYKIPKFF